MLDKYRGKKVFIEFDTPYNRGLVNITAKHRSKIKRIDVTLYNSKVGITEINLIKEYNDVNKELKDFLENEEIWGYYISYDLKLMYSVDIDINIAGDVKNLVISDSEKYRGNRIIREDLIGVKTGEKNILEINHMLYEKFKHNIEKDEYKNLMSLTRIVSKGEYFGIMNDIDKEKQEEYVKDLENKIDMLRLDLKNKYGIKRWGISELIEKLYTKYNITTKDMDKHEIMNLDKEHKGLEVVTKFRENRAISKYRNSLASIDRSIMLNINNLYSINTNKDITSIHKEHMHILDAGSNKYYYINIKAPLIESKYAELIINNRVINEKTYTKNIGKKIYGNKKLTQDEMRQINFYNIYRVYLSDSEAFNIHRSNLARIYFGMDMDNFEDKYMEIVPLYKKQKGLIKDMNKLILSKFKILEEKLSTYNKFAITLSYIGFNKEIVFKVSNKINPYRALKLVYDSFETTSDIGIDLYNELKVFDSFGDIKTNDNIYKEQIIKGFNNIEKEKVRDVVKYVYKK